MVVRSFYLVGQDIATYRHEIEVDPNNDMNFLKVAIATSYHVVDPQGIAFQSTVDGQLDDVSNILDCDTDIGITIDGNAIRDPSGPRKLPFVGSYYEVYPDHLGNHQRLFDQHGSVIHYEAMGTQNYLTNDPAVMAVIFAESNFFSKLINSAHPLSAMKNNEALFVGDSDTDNWKAAHKFLPPAMSPKAVRHYTPLMQDSVRESFRAFDKLDEDGEAWNVYQFMLKLASQTVFKFVLGYNAKSFETPDTSIDELVIDIATLLSLNKKIATMGAWYKKLDIIPGTAGYRLNAVNAKIFAKVQKAIDEAPKGSLEDTLPLHDAALSATCVVDYLRRAVDDKGQRLPMDLVLPNTVVMSGAGFTTTSALLSWLIYSLCAYDGCQDKILQELVDHGVNSNTNWTPELYESLSYMNNFIKETQRRHGPAFQPARTAKVDCIVPGGYKIPQGAVIINAIHAMHTNPKIWSEADKFDPDRWNDDNEGSHGKVEREGDTMTKAKSSGRKKAFLPFATGPRGCIGFNFALGEVKVLLPELVYRYEFTKVGDQGVEYDPEFQLIRPLNFYVRAKKRTSWPAPPNEAT